MARGLPFTCDARVHRPSSRGHMSASYCGPDCISCRHALPTREESASNETKSTLGPRTQKDGGRSESGVFFEGRSKPGQTDNQAERQAGIALSRASKSRSEHISLRMIRWIACTVEIGAGGGEGTTVCPLCRKRRLPQGTAGRHRDVYC